jgi:hypothetical protein
VHGALSTAESDGAGPQARYRPAKTPEGFASNVLRLFGPSRRKQVPGGIVKRHCLFRSVNSSRICSISTRNASYSPIFLCRNRTVTPAFAFMPRGVNRYM